MLISCSWMVDAVCFRKKDSKWVMNTPVACAGEEKNLKTKRRPAVALESVWQSSA